MTGLTYNRSVWCQSSDTVHRIQGHRARIHLTPRYSTLPSISSWFRFWALNIQSITTLGNLPLSVPSFFFSFFVTWSWFFQMESLTLPNHNFWLIFALLYAFFFRLAPLSVIPFGWSSASCIFRNYSCRLCLVVLRGRISLENDCLFNWSCMRMCFINLLKDAIACRVSQTMWTEDILNVFPSFLLSFSLPFFSSFSFSILWGQNAMIL